MSSDKGLVATTLPQRSEGEAVQTLGKRLSRASRSDNLLSDLTERLKSYFRGGKTAFPDEINLSGATPFQSRVWQATRLIPYGETRSYLWVAEQVGKPAAVRAVGQALGKNPVPVIIPCHRVIAADGGLGGFTGGLAMKRRLLELESAAELYEAVTNNGS